LCHHERGLWFPFLFDQRLTVGIDLEHYLKTQVTTFNQEKEIARILHLKDMTRNPIEVLELPVDVWKTFELNDRDIKLQYRKKSLLLHPDKCKLDKASDAFDLLKDAETWLMNRAQREAILQCMRDSKLILDRTLKRKGSQLDSDSPEYLLQLRMLVRQQLEDVQKREELRMKNEVERRNKEAEEALKDMKRKEERAKIWDSVMTDGKTHEE
jgi:DnaJ family protein C protein 8